MAIANLIDPIAELRGQLKNTDKVYARMLNGKCVLQRKPNRAEHVPTKREAENRRRFGEKYGTSRKHGERI